MKIAVTGANGFIGTNLIKRLKSSGLACSVFDRTKHNILKSKTLKNFLKGADAVIHLAGVNKNGRLKDIVETNILGTKKLLDSMCRFCPGAKLIFASSFCVYDENDIFGLSKLTGEELIKDYVLYGLLKKAVILRFSNIYGPNCKPFKNSAVATFAYLIRNNKEIAINGTGKQTRDFLYVDDAVSAIEKSLRINFKKGCKIFDIFSKKKTSINTIIQMLGKLANRKALIRYNGKNPEAISGIKKNKNLKQMPDWKALVSLEQGLERLMNEN